MTSKRMTSEQERKAIAIELCKQQIETIKWKINCYEKKEDPMDYVNERYECIESLEKWEIMLDVLTAETPKTILV